MKNKLLTVTTIESNDHLNVNKFDLMLIISLPLVLDKKFIPMANNYPEIMTIYEASEI